MHNTFYKKYIRFFGIVSGGIAIDQVTKYYVLTYFNKCVEICEWIRFLPTYNTGVSWGLFSKLGKTFKWIFFGISTTLIILFFRIFLKEQRVSTQWAISLIIAGACGNLVDRVRLGAVFDFLSIHWQSFHFPVFNVADMLITVGVTILIRDYYKWKH